MFGNSQDLNIRMTADASQATRELSGFRSSFTELGSKISLATQALGAFRDVAVKAFEMGQAGAELERTQGKLDNLAVSIGTTSDALIERMSAASSGMMSNAEIIQSATEIISLGLAGNEDDVIRLATIVSELGWDMQQVILTFANDSVMRLDALGLSVEDVTARAREFEAAGMAASLAFDQAVMAAAEDKIKLVGSAAETAAGQYKILEANIADVRAEWEALVNRAILPAIKKLNENADEANLLSDAYKMGAITAGEYNATLYNVTFSSENAILSTEELTQRVVEFNLETDREIARLLAINDLLGITAQTSDWLESTLDSAATETDQMADAMGGLERPTAAVSTKMERVNAEMRELAEENQARIQALSDFRTEFDKLGDGRASPIAAFISDLKFLEAGGADIATLMSDIRTALEEGMDPEDAGDAIAATLVAALLAEMEAGLTDLDAAKQTLVETLGITSDEAAGMLSEFETAADAIANAEREMEIAVMLDDRDGTLDQLERLFGPSGLRDADINVNVSYSGQPPGATGGKTGKLRGHSGLDFVVPPGYPNDSFGPIYAESDEHVQITPANQTTNAFGGITININGAGDPQMIAEAVAQELGALANRGRSAGARYIGQ